MIDLEKKIFPFLKKSILWEKVNSYLTEGAKGNRDNFNKNPLHFNVIRFAGSYPSLFSAFVFKQVKRNLLFIYADKEEAAYALNEAEDMIGKENVLFYPSSYLQPYQIEKVHNANVVLRTEVINSIKETDKHFLIISYAEALSEKIIDKQNLNSISHAIRVGDKIDVSFLNEVLFSFNFKRTDFVTEPGEFSVRGGIIDIFSFSNEKPYRIGFFGSEIETIRKFNIETQLSEKNIQECIIIPNIDILGDQKINEKRISFLDYLTKDAFIFAKDLSLILEEINKKYLQAEKNYSQLSGEIKRKTPLELYNTSDDFTQQVLNFSLLEFSIAPKFNEWENISLNQSEQAVFHKQFDLLAEDLKEKTSKGISNFIFFNSEKQEERLKEIFEDTDKDVKFTGIHCNLSKGFVDDKFCIYTDHQIFERYHKYTLRNSFSKSETLTLKELTDLKVGDYVVHIDHGIGKFMGLVKIKNEETIQETIKLIYKNNDILYVNIHSLHKISRYSGKEGAEITLNQLGSSAWKTLTNKAKRKVKEVAFDLIKLYAQRKSEKGFAFSPDGYLQNELEASFMYEDTPDQEKATEEVKKDMEKMTVMDRLICGDVGFGKTEIAIRAAFKAATDGKQSVIMVPTTILALQHHKTFSERLKEFPVKVEYLNRFKSSKEKKEILKELEEGKIDIIIGTQQLIGKDVKFHDLGLLIIDEEHKFGVSVKDKIKTIKTSVDTLTLTATPIPRTLQFSLMAARDLSVIKTPPPNRHPIKTSLIGFNEERIRDAIHYELMRNGQIYFINNRIESLQTIAGMIQRLVPEARVMTGHGQMDGKKLEQLMIDFMEGGFDVLIATTIIESGLDVPNANTIFINDAQHFGLADLHQMRGRVGRSNRNSFCYLITPPFDILTNEARKRLQALETFSDLGSGFNIAMKDLEIRGAGDLLGAEQSGFFTEIGFEAYQQILNESIEELKENEFSDLFEEENKNKEFIKEVHIDTDFELMIPDEYVNKVEERFNLYKKLAEISNNEELEKFRTELIDRFGTLPKSVEELLESIRLKWLAKKLGFEKLIIKKGVLLAYFINDPNSNYYHSDKFQSIIQFLQNNPSEAILKEKHSGNQLQLYLRKDHIKNINQIMELLNKIETI